MDGGKERPIFPELASPTIAALIADVGCCVASNTLAQVGCRDRSIFDAAPRGVVVHRGQVLVLFENVAYVGGMARWFALRPREMQWVKSVPLEVPRPEDLQPQLDAFDAVLLGGHEDAAEQEAVH